MKHAFDNDAFDVAIAGGGFVGITCALALARGGVRAALIDSGSEGGDGNAPRPIALAEGSRRIFESLGVWEEIGAGATPIRHIHVSDRGRFGFTRLKARDYGVDALGYVSVRLTNVQASPCFGPRASGTHIFHGIASGSKAMVMAAGGRWKLGCWRRLTADVPCCDDWVASQHVKGTGGKAPSPPA